MAPKIPNNVESVPAKDERHGRDECEDIGRKHLVREYMSPAGLCRYCIRGRLAVGARPLILFPHD
jgi:ribosomal protein S14